MNSYEIFYKAIIKRIVRMIVIAGNLRCREHGKANYMQARVIDDVIDELGGYITVSMMYRDGKDTAEIAESRGWPTY